MIGKVAIEGDVIAEIAGIKESTTTEIKGMAGSDQDRDLEIVKIRIKREEERGQALLIQIIPRKDEI
jgi:hypothetical protein